MLHPHLSYYFSWYVLFLGIGLVAISAVEFFAAAKIYSLWKKWIFNRLFPIHGFLLSVGGLPLTFFRDTIPGKIMFCIGILVVMTGPFMVLFPSKIRDMFTITESELEEEGDAEGLVYFDAVTKIAAGAFFIFTIISYGTLG